MPSKNKIILFYVEVCSPKIKTFPTVEAANRFFTEVQARVRLPRNDDGSDTWIEAIVEGKLTFLNPKFREVAPEDNE